MKPDNIEMEKDEGGVEMPGTVIKKQYDQINKHRCASGIEPNGDKKSILIEKIKHVIVKMVHELF